MQKHLSTFMAIKCWNKRRNILLMIIQKSTLICSFLVCSFGILQHFNIQKDIHWRRWALLILLTHSVISAFIGVLGISFLLCIQNLGFLPNVIWLAPSFFCATVAESKQFGTCSPSSGPVWKLTIKHSKNLVFCSPSVPNPDDFLSFLQHKRRC